MASPPRLAKIADPGRRPSAQDLARLTGLPPEEMEQFRGLWPGLPVERRRHIVATMALLAEDDLTLDFEDIFAFTLKDGDEEVRLGSLEGLAGSENPHLVEPLIALMEQDRTESVRATAAATLGTFTLMSELGKLRPQMGARLEAALLSIARSPGEPAQVRRRALEALGPLSRGPVQELIRQSYYQSEHQLKLGALYAMGMNSDPGWLPLLLQELKSADTETRYEAVNACGELGLEEAIPPLAQLLSDPDSQVQLAVVAALGHIGGPVAKEKLQECLEQGSPHLQEAARNALEDLASGWDDLFSLGPDE
ncbi:MAG: HEAT repeat domain-containing protein [Chloroflexi bacterium]|nr:HEAT repeat domain-containing protein [Chloroflexota bacterium]